MTILIVVALLNLGAMQLSKRTSLKSSSAYLGFISLCLMAIWTGGLVNMLLPVTLVIFIGIIVINIAQILKNGLKNWLSDLKSYINLTVGLNWLSSLCFFAIFALQKPVFYYWDEYSFWGSAAKYVKTTGRLYTIGQTPLNSLRPLPCGHTILNYLFQFFSKDFTEYLLLLAYAFFFFAVFAAVAQLVVEKQNKPYIGVAVYIALALSPFMAIYNTISLDYTAISYAYGTSMVDFLIPVACLGALAVFLANKNSLWYLAPLAFIATIKNTSIAFALVCAAVFACVIFFEEKMKITKKIVQIVITFSIPVFVAFAWSTHLNFTYIPPIPPEISVHPVVTELSSPKEEVEVIEEPAVSVEPIKENLSQQSQQIGTVKSIFIPKYRTDRYNEVLKDMANQFKTSKITFVAKDYILVIFLIALGLFTVILTPKNKKITVFFVNLGLAVGCLVYAVGISYFISTFNDGMVEYARYMTSYYFMWLYISLVFFWLSLENKELIREISLAVCLALGLWTVGSIGLDHTVINASDYTYLYTREVKKSTAEINKVLKKGDRVYLAVADQDGGSYLTYCYMLYPAIAATDTNNTGIDFTISFRTALDPLSDRQYYNVASPEDFTKIMRSYFDYVMVINPDEEFIEGYRQLFSDNITIGSLYKIVPTGDVPMQVVKG